MVRGLQDGYSLFSAVVWHLFKHPTHGQHSFWLSFLAVVPWSQCFWRFDLWQVGHVGLSWYGAAKVAQPVVQHLIFVSLAPCFFCFWWSLTHVWQVHLSWFGAVQASTAFGEAPMQPVHVWVAQHWIGIISCCPCDLSPWWLLTGCIFGK